MAKRRLLQWMRDRLCAYAQNIVLPPVEKRNLDAAYKRAATLVTNVVTKKFPVSEMAVLNKWKSATHCIEPKLQFPNGVVAQFIFVADEAPLRPDEFDYRNQVFLADAATAAAVDKWLTCKEAFETERKKRLSAYAAMIAGAGYVEDVIDIWPEAKTILPAGSPPIALGPEQIALVKADQRERKAA